MDETEIETQIRQMNTLTQQDNALDINIIDGRFYFGIKSCWTPREKEIMLEESARRMNALLSRVKGGD